MRIVSLSIKNYRNIDQLKIDFSENCSIYYFTGDNGIGKSNVLDLLYYIFTKKYCLIADSEKKEQEKPFEFKIEISLDLPEIGLFDDLQEDESNLVWRYTQYSEEEYGWFYSDATYNNYAESKQFDSTKNKLTVIPCYRYSPRYDLNREILQNNPIIKKFIKNLIKKYYDGGEISTTPLIDTVIEKINGVFKDIFQNPNPKLKISTDNSDPIEAIFYMMFLSSQGPEEEPLQQLGRGRSYYLYPYIDFLAYIFDDLHDKGGLDRLLTENQNSWYLVPIILFDEPEVFLSPFMQRQFMNDWLALCENSKLFQLFQTPETEDIYTLSIKPIFYVATHSAHIIPHLNFHQEKNKLSIYRLYKKENNIEVGQLSEKNRELKQFLLFDRHIFEGLFSNIVILLEGDTEAGFIDALIEKERIDIHQKKILIIRANPGNFPNLSKIFEDYGITIYIVTDRDELVPKQSPRVKALEDLVKENQKSQVFISDGYDFEDSLLYENKDNLIFFTEISTDLKEDYKKNSKNSMTDENYLKRLVYLRNHKTLEDNYQLAKKIFEKKDLKVPPYIQKLIEELKNE